MIQFVAAKVEVRYLNRGGRDGWGYVPWCVTHTAPTTTSRSVVTPADLGIDLPNDQVVPDVAASIVASEDALPSYDDLFAPAGAEAVNSPTGEVFFLVVVGLGENKEDRHTCWFCGLSALNCNFFSGLCFNFCQVLMDCVLLSFSGGARAQPPRRTVWFDGSVDDADDDDVIFDDVDDDDEDEVENQPRGRSSLARTIARLRRRVLRRH